MGGKPAGREERGAAPEDGRDHKTRPASGKQSRLRPSRPARCTLLRLIRNRHAISLAALHASLRLQVTCRSSSGPAGSGFLSRRPARRPFAPRSSHCAGVCQGARRTCSAGAGAIVARRLASRRPAGSCAVRTVPAPAGGAEPTGSTRTRDPTVPSGGGRARHLPAPLVQEMLGDEPCRAPGGLGMDTGLEFSRGLPARRDRPQAVEPLRGGPSPGRARRAVRHRSAGVPMPRAP
jgi:hypothetical protein